MISTPSIQRIVSIAVALGTLGLASTCATSRRSEPPGSAVPTNSPMEKSQSDFAQAPPAAEAHEAPVRTDDKASLPPPAPVARSAPAVAPAGRKPSATAGQGRPSDGSRPKRAAAAESLSPEKKSKEANRDLLTGSDELENDPLLPSVNDPNDLRVALQDWRNAADQLTTSQGCDDGCRAFQSMQRAAARICNLVLNQDPALRCAAAKSRVTDAERGLSQRCGKCQH